MPNIKVLHRFTISAIVIKKLTEENRVMRNRLPRLDDKRYSIDTAISPYGAHVLSSYHAISL